MITKIKGYGPNPMWAIGPYQSNALDQAKNLTNYFDMVVLNPDNHLGKIVPIGGVVASRTIITPQAVGPDGCCGNKAIRLDVEYKDIQARMPEIMDEVFAKIPFGVGKYNPSSKLHDAPVFDRPEWNSNLLLEGLLPMARQQIGSVGSGNHFVNVMVDNEGMVWVAVHFGSRGIGYNVSSRLNALKGYNENKTTEPLILEIGGEDFSLYMDALSVLHDYAYQGRDIVCHAVRKIIGGSVTHSVHNNHNAIWREEIDGEVYYVGRKGATPSRQESFIGGSMAEPSLIVKGLSNEFGRMSLYSLPHGAGRQMSRNVAKKTIKLEAMRAWLDLAGVELRGAGLDEAPDAYKRLEEVMESCKDGYEEIWRLYPKGVAMAGADHFDPYND